MINFTRELRIVPPDTRKSPRILAGTGHLSEDQEGEYGECAVRGQVATGDEDEESSQVVADEQNILRKEDEVVKKIGYEVSNTVFED